MSKILLLLTALVGTGFLIITTTSSAQAARVLTDDEIQQIRDSCVNAQKVLSNLYNSDAVLRVNLGQRYENISNELMSPLNERLANNKIDASPLTNVTKQYEDAVAAYKTTYHEYYDSLESTKSMDCQAQPIEFYMRIEILRDYRETLAGQVAAINRQAINYQTEFRKIRDGQVIAN